MEHITIPVQDQLLQVEDILLREVISGMESLDSISKYVIKNGGKRIRPTLFLLAARMAGAKDEKLPKIAAAIELLHTASLLHDDVIDDAAMRRGQMSAKAKWGNQVSVLVGDFFLCRASQIFVEYGEKRMMEAVTAAISATTKGELLEIVHQNDVATDTAVYMEIISGKTAALFSLAGNVAAVVAGLGPNFVESLSEFGADVGRAFQLADDALDYVCDETQFGKHAGTDLREGKLTYPLIVALAKCSDAEKNLIRDTIVAGRCSEQEFKEIAEIISRHGGIEATWRLAKELSEKAKERLSMFKPSIERDSLLMLADNAVHRRE